jgi:hypothetical protein
MTQSVSIRVNPWLSVVIRGPKQKAPPRNLGGAKVAMLSVSDVRRLRAQPGRPAEAGMMVPVMVRETEHLLPA